MASNAHIHLRSGRLEVELAPATGGSIVRFDFNGDDGEKWPVLRGADPAEVSVLAMGSFPLVPFCNRIRDGSFHFRGRDVRLRPNMAGDASPLHGDGWLARWDVEHHAATSAVLAYRHAPGEWPWAYQAGQHFSLDDDGLSMVLSCRNLSEEPMPCGLGVHPYFFCSGDTELDTDIIDVWTVDADVLPVERKPATGRYDLRRRRICGQNLDNGFSDWSGEALIRDPGLPFEIRLTSPDARFFQVYSPPEGGLFVAEPVSHANAALNALEREWPELGLVVLEAGAEAKLETRLEVALVR